MRYVLSPLLVSFLMLTGCLGGIQAQMAKDSKMVRVRDCERKTTEVVDGGTKVVTESLKCKEYKEPK